jgi:hypothetical protein
MSKIDTVSLPRVTVGPEGGEPKTEDDEP